LNGATHAQEAANIFSTSHAISVVNVSLRGKYSNNFEDELQNSV
jgi:hypothetical protein